MFVVEKRLSWSDGSVVNYQSWAPGEPNEVAGGAEDYVEMDFRLIGRCTGSQYAANQNNGCETSEFRNGEWNDNQDNGDGGSNPEFPLCQTARFVNPLQSEYVGCFTDSPDRDMEGIQASVGGDMEFFDMGDNGSADTCATLCAGFTHFGLQYGNQVSCSAPLAVVVVLLTWLSSRSASATTRTRWHRAGCRTPSATRRAPATRARCAAGPGRTPSIR